MPISRAIRLTSSTAVFAIAASFFPAAPAHSAEGCITVEVQNVRPQQGQLLVAAYGDAESFGKRPMAQVKVPAGDAVTSLQLCGITGTTVALTMYQDLDGDGKMGRNVLGMPTEPWGSSGAPGMFGPSWETGKVALDGSPVVVKLSQ
jgi:uncharacterized protein (DUF2141 family)